MTWTWLTVEEAGQGHRHASWKHLKYLEGHGDLDWIASPRSERYYTTLRWNEHTDGMQGLLQAFLSAI